MAKPPNRELLENSAQGGPFPFGCTLAAGRSCNGLCASLGHRVALGHADWHARDVVTELRILPAFKMLLKAADRRPPLEKNKISGSRGVGEVYKYAQNFILVIFFVGSKNFGLENFAFPEVWEVPGGF